MIVFRDGHINRPPGRCASKSRTCSTSFATTSRQAGARRVWYSGGVNASPRGSVFSVPGRREWRFVPDGRDRFCVLHGDLAGALNNGSHVGGGDDDSARRGGGEVGAGGEPPPPHGDYRAVGLEGGDNVTPPARCFTSAIDG